MSGLYIHVPFCRKACHYCDFHFSTSVQKTQEMIVAMLSEIRMRQKFIKTPIESIYFGGGTPSILTKGQIFEIIETISKYFEIKPNAEITFEANPDDISLNFAEELFDLGINRVSLGTQTFDDAILKSLNRSHSKVQIFSAVKNLQMAGIKSLNLDLIFGLPNSTMKTVENDLKQLLILEPDHISAYWLTIENNTAFSRWHKKGTLDVISDQHAIKQWDLIRDTLKSNNYKQYEISNYSLKGKEAKHNSNYWKGNHYLGIGPSAHSFDGKNRVWSISNNQKYIKSINNGKLPLEIEELTIYDQINEYVMTRLRTSWGINLKYLRKKFHYDLYYTHRLTVDKYVSTQDIILKNDHLYITRAGQEIVDKIASELFEI